jgi:hypothetical protein
LTIKLVLCDGTPQAPPFLFTLNCVTFDPLTTDNAIKIEKHLSLLTNISRLMEVSCSKVKRDDDDQETSFQSGFLFIAG